MSVTNVHTKRDKCAHAYSFSQKCLTRNDGNHNIIFYQSQLKIIESNEDRPNGKETRIAKNFFILET